MPTQVEPGDDFTDLSAEVQQLRNRLRTLEPEDIVKLGDGFRRLRRTLTLLEERLGSAPDSPPAGQLPDRLWRATWAQALALAETGYHEALAALAAEESVAARERCTQAILAYDKLLAMFPPRP
jgi:hypothetical protein